MPQQSADAIIVVLAFEIRLHRQLFASNQYIVAYQYILCLEYNNTNSHTF